MRTRKKPWADAELDSNKRVVKNPADSKGRWKEYFGGERPVYVEIGCGKGGFITKNAASCPGVCFIGIERQPSVLAVAARKAPEELDNLAFIQGTAEKLSDYFCEGEIDRLYLNFSDPWPKKRWAKRRLTHKNFLDLYRLMLGGDKEVFMKTDNRGLFEFSLNSFCGDGWQLSNISLDLHSSGIEDNIMTEYEEKFSSMGMPIYRLEARLGTGSKNPRS